MRILTRAGVWTVPVSQAFVWNDKIFEYYTLYNIFLKYFESTLPKAEPDGAAEENR